MVHLRRAGDPRGGTRGSVPVRRRYRCRARSYTFLRLLTFVSRSRQRPRDILMAFLGEPLEVLHVSLGEDVRPRHARSDGEIDAFKERGRIARREGLRSTVAGAKGSDERDSNALE